MTAVISRRRFASACRHAETSLANDADPFSSNPAGNTTHNDHPTSVSPRTTRHPATIEPARARHSLDDVVRLASHGHFDRSPSLRLHLDDGIRHCFGCGQTAGVVEWVCQGEGERMASGDPHPRLGPHARTHIPPTRVVALAQGLFFKSTPGGKVLRGPRGGCRDDPCPGLLVTADGPAL